MERGGNCKGFQQAFPELGIDFREASKKLAYN
jgi:hypothetical protein